MLNYRSLNMTTDQEDVTDKNPVHPLYPLSYPLVSSCNIISTLTELYIEAGESTKVFCLAIFQTGICACAPSERILAYKGSGTIPRSSPLLPHLCKPHS
jgi:hypothetical protein